MPIKVTATLCSNEAIRGPITALCSVPMCLPDISKSSGGATADGQHSLRRRRRRIEFASQGRSILWTVGSGPSSMAGVAAAAAADGDATSSRTMLTEGCVRLDIADYCDHDDAAAERRKGSSGEGVDGAVDGSPAATAQLILGNNTINHTQTQSSFKSKHSNSCASGRSASLTAVRDGSSRLSYYSHATITAMTVVAPSSFASAEHSPILFIAIGPFVVTVSVAALLQWAAAASSALSSSVSSSSTSSSSVSAIPLDFIDVTNALPLRPLQVARIQSVVATAAAVGTSTGASAAGPTADQHSSMHAPSSHHHQFVNGGAGKSGCGPITAINTACGTSSSYYYCIVQTTCGQSAVVKLELRRRVVASPLYSEGSLGRDEGHDAAAPYSSPFSAPLLHQLSMVPIHATDAQSGGPHSNSTSVVGTSLAATAVFLSVPKADDHHQLSSTPASSSSPPPPLPSAKEGGFDALCFFGSYSGNVTVQRLTTAPSSLPSAVAAAVSPSSSLSCPSSSTSLTSSLSSRLHSIVPAHKAACSILGLAAMTMVRSACRRNKGSDGGALIDVLLASGADDRTASVWRLRLAPHHSSSSSSSAMASSPQLSSSCANASASPTRSSTCSQDSSPSWELLWRYQPSTAAAAAAASGASSAHRYPSSSTACHQHWPSIGRVRCVAFMTSAAAVHSAGAAHRQHTIERADVGDVAGSSGALCATTIALAAAPLALAMGTDCGAVLVCPIPTHSSPSDGAEEGKEKKEKESDRQCAPPLIPIPPPPLIPTLVPPPLIIPPPPQYISQSLATAQLFKGQGCGAIIAYPLGDRCGDGDGDRDGGTPPRDGGHGSSRDSACSGSNNDSFCVVAGGWCGSLWRRRYAATATMAPTTTTMPAATDCGATPMTIHSKAMGAPKQPVIRCVASVLPLAGGSSGLPCLTLTVDADYAMTVGVGGGEGAGPVAVAGSGKSASPHIYSQFPSSTASEDTAASGEEGEGGVAGLKGLPSCVWAGWRASSPSHWRHRGGGGGGGGEASDDAGGGLAGPALRLIVVIGTDRGELLVLSCGGAEGLLLLAPSTTAPTVTHPAGTNTSRGSTMAVEGRLLYCPNAFRATATATTIGSSTCGSNAPPPSLPAAGSASSTSGRFTQLVHISTTTAGSPANIGMPHHDDDGYVVFAACDGISKQAYVLRIALSGGGGGGAATAASLVDALPLPLEGLSGQSALTASFGSLLLGGGGDASKGTGRREIILAVGTDKGEVGLVSYAFSIASSSPPPLPTLVSVAAADSLGGTSTGASSSASLAVVFPLTSVPYHFLPELKRPAIQALGLRLRRAGGGRAASPPPTQHFGLFVDAYASDGHYWTLCCDYYPTLLCRRGGRSDLVAHAQRSNMHNGSSGLFGVGYCYWSAASKLPCPISKVMLLSTSIVSSSGMGAVLVGMLSATQLVVMTRGGGGGDDGAGGAKWSIAYQLSIGGSGSASAALPPPRHLKVALAASSLPNAVHSTSSPSPAALLFSFVGNGPPPSSPPANTININNSSGMPMTVMMMTRNNTNFPYAVVCPIEAIHSPIEKAVGHSGGVGRRREEGPRAPASSPFLTLSSSPSASAVSGYDMGCCIAVRRGGSGSNSASAAVVVFGGEDAGLAAIFPLPPSSLLLSPRHGPLGGRSYYAHYFGPHRANVLGMASFALSSSWRGDDAKGYHGDDYMVSVGSFASIGLWRVDGGRAMRGSGSLTWGSGSSGGEGTRAEAVVEGPQRYHDADLHGEEGGEEKRDASSSLPSMPAGGALEQVWGEPRQYQSATGQHGKRKGPAAAASLPISTTSVHVCGAALEATPRYLCVCAATDGDDSQTDTQHQMEGSLVTTDAALGVGVVGEAATGSSTHRSNANNAVICVGASNGDALFWRVGGRRAQPPSLAPNVDVSPLVVHALPFRQPRRRGQAGEESAARDDHTAPATSDDDDDAHSSDDDDDDSDEDDVYGNIRSPIFAVDSIAVASLLPLSTNVRPTSPSALPLRLFVTGDKAGQLRCFVVWAEGGGNVSAASSDPALPPYAEEIPFVNVPTAVDGGNAADDGLDGYMTAAAASLSSPLHRCCGVGDSINAVALLPSHCPGECDLFVGLDGGEVRWYRLGVIQVPTDRCDDDDVNGNDSCDAHLCDASGSSREGRSSPAVSCLGFTLRGGADDSNRSRRGCTASAAVPSSSSSSSPSPFPLPIASIPLGFTCVRRIRAVPIPCGGRDGSDQRFLLVVLQDGLVTVLAPACRWGAAMAPPPSHQADDGEAAHATGGMVGAAAAAVVPLFVSAAVNGSTTMFQTVHQYVPQIRLVTDIAIASWSPVTAGAGGSAAVGVRIGVVLCGQGYESTDLTVHFTSSPS